MLKPFLIINIGEKWKKDKKMGYEIIDTKVETSGLVLEPAIALDHFENHLEGLRIAYLEARQHGASEDVGRVLGQIDFILDVMNQQGIYDN